MAFAPSRLHLAVLLAVALAAPVAAVQSQAPKPSPPRPQPPVQAAANARVYLAVGGMNCSTCASTIKAMLRRTAGVKSATVSYDQGEAVVEYDPKVTSHSAIIRVIENLGYSARVKA